MDGENHGNPYSKWIMIWGGKVPPFKETSQWPETWSSSMAPAGLRKLHFFTFDVAEWSGH